MIRSIDTSLTLIQRDRDVMVDANTFADPDRHFIIRNPTVGAALLEAVTREAPRKKFKVGGPSVGADVDFFVLDLWRDKTISRELARIIDGGFLDAVNRAVKSAMEKSDGLLNDDATTALEAVGEVLELRRFIANAAALKGVRRSQSELLFHHAAE